MLFTLSVEKRMQTAAIAGFILPLAVFAQQTAPGRRTFINNKGPLTAGSSRPARDIAKQFLTSAAPELGLSAGDLGSVYVAREYTDAHNGVTHILYRQQFQGIDVYNAAWVVNVDAGGRVLNAGGQFYSAPQAAAPAMAAAFSAVRPAIRAVNPRAARRFAPFESRTPPRHRGGIRFSGGDVSPDDVEGRMIWFAVRGTLRPAWVFDVLAEDGVTRYAAVVDSESKRVIAKRPLTFFDGPNDARGLVFDRESPQPNPSPGTLLTSAPPLVARTVQSFQGDPIASPLGWIYGGETAGNNVVAGENLLGVYFLRTPDTAKAADNHFEFPLELGAGAPNPLQFKDAVTTDLFYWMNRAHDLHYAAGFTEAAGNFQMNNIGRGGLGGDPMYVYSHFGAAAPNSAARANAFFTSRGVEDGSPSMIAMFISDGGRGSFFTDGSLDAVVMIHEYTHGVSWRLLPDGYDSYQVAAMGEGWSDFYALEFTLPDSAPLGGVYPSTEYFNQSWGQGSIRTRPYSTDLEVNPLTFAALGEVIPAPEVHADGEIWVEALWELRANLITQFGEAEGRRRVRLLVMDAMKLAPPRSTMVDMRDAILLADRVDFDGASQEGVWAAFAKRGLGALAYSGDADSAHITASFDPPSNRARIGFYDHPITIGEPARVIAQDSNYSEPTVRVQVINGGGDLEDVVLRRTGSIYAGTVPTISSGAVVRGDGRLQMTSGDFVTVFYNDADTGAGFEQVTASTPARLPFTPLLERPAFEFTGETPLDMSSGVRRVDLPFEFPFFEKKYRSIIVDEWGILVFRDTGYGATEQLSNCHDAYALNFATGIAPLWVPLTTMGLAQKD
jgi:extracellular elastinolytic metalloproteinase